MTLQEIKQYFIEYGVDVSSVKLSKEEKVTLELATHFRDAPLEAIAPLEALILQRMSDPRFFPRGSWETVEGVNPSNKHQWAGLVIDQILREGRAYNSFLDYESR